MLAEILFIAVPIALIIFCAVSVSRYAEAKNANKKSPGIFTEEEIKLRRVLMIISISLIALAVIVFAVLAVMLFFAIAFM